MITNTQPNNAEELSAAEKRKAYSKAYHEKNKERMNAQSKAYYEKNKGKINALASVYYKNNKDAYEQYRILNADKIKKRHKERMETDPDYKFKERTRVLLWHTFKRLGMNKHTNTVELLGCTWQEAKAHFEKLFKPGMTWENHGKWHIDHIKPVAHFTSENIAQMNHISNLQPLWAEENLTKSSKYTL